MPHVFMMLDVAKWFKSVLEIRDECAVKLNEADESGNIANKAGCGPVIKQLMFEHCVAIAVRLDINSHKFETFEEEISFFN